MRYVIRCINDPELLWSNDEGYTDSDNFEVFTAEETEIYDLPIEGEWIELITL
jgi:hypothetical protein